MKGIKFTAREKQKALELWGKCGDYFYAAKKSKCTVQSLYR